MTGPVPLHELHKNDVNDKWLPFYTRRWGCHRRWCRRSSCGRVWSPWPHPSPAPPPPPGTRRPAAARSLPRCSQHSLTSASRAQSGGRCNLKIITQCLWLTDWEQRNKNEYQNNIHLCLTTVFRVENMSTTIEDKDIMILWHYVDIDIFQFCIVKTKIRRDRNSYVIFSCTQSNLCECLWRFTNGGALVPLHTLWMPTVRALRRFILLLHIKWKFIDFC